MSGDTAEDRQLRRLVTWHRRGAVAIGALVLAAYVGRVLYTGERTPSADAWGTFGDFIGGILNPMIAYMALYWLTQSVLIQKAELGDSRAALEKSVQIGALSAICTYYTDEISAIDSLIVSLQQDYSFSKEVLNPDAIEVYQTTIQKLTADITKIRDERRKTMNKRNSPTSTVLVPTASGRHHRLECVPA